VTRGDRDLPSPVIVASVRKLFRRGRCRERDGITWRLKIFVFVTGDDRCFLSSALRLADHQARHSELGGRDAHHMRAFGRARVPLTPRAPVPGKRDSDDCCLVGREIK